MSVVQIYTGTSGLVLPVPNKAAYPPEFREKSRLCYYSSLFRSIEINSSFYKVPLAKTIERWVEEVESPFRFTFKLWKGITHTGGLAFSPEDVALFMSRISAAGSSCGCLLIQFPPSLTISYIAQLEKLLQAIISVNSYSPWKLALEFRHPSWYENDVYSLVERYNALIVLHDLPSSAAPLVADVSDVVYLRFHGPNGGYRGSYTDDFLYEYAQYIKEWVADGKVVYAYFNNTMGNAVQNLISLNAHLNQMTG